MSNVPENADLLQQLMDNIADNIFFKDRDSKFIMINQANAAWFGLKDAVDAIGKSDFDFFDETHAARQIEEERQIMETGKPMLCEVQSSDPGGHLGWGSVTKMPLRDKQGRVIGIMGIGRDITELKNNELALNKAHDQIADDLQMAAKLQQAFLPQDYPTFPDVEGRPLIGFHHYYEAHVELGGDFCSVFKLGDTKAGLLICDVMGHGVRAALVTGIIHAIAEELVRKERSPGAFLTALNKRLPPILQTKEEYLFATAAYLTIDVANGALAAASAGHPPPFLIQPQRTRVSELDGLKRARGPALAIVADFVYQDFEMSLNPGEELLMYTDGVCEAMNAASDEFGVAHLQETILDYNTLPLDQLVARIIDVVREHTGTRKLGDDICLLGFSLMRPAGHESR